MASGLQAHRSDSSSLPGLWAAGIRRTLLAQFSFSASGGEVCRLHRLLIGSIADAFSPGAEMCGQWRSTRIHLATLQRVGFDSPLFRVR